MFVKLLVNTHEITVNGLISRQSSRVFDLSPLSVDALAYTFYMELQKNDEADWNMTVPVLYSYILQSKHFYMKRLNENDKIGIPHIAGE